MSLNHLVNENDSQVTSEVEFTVAGTVIPTSAVFTVKLAKIYLTRFKVKPEKYSIIHEDHDDKDTTSCLPGEIEQENDNIAQ